MRRKKSFKYVSSNINTNISLLFQTVQSDKQNEIEQLQKRCTDQNNRLRNLEEQIDKLEKARSQVYNDMVNQSY